jgi:hypothetical protein
MYSDKSRSSLYDETVQKRNLTIVFITGIFLLHVHALIYARITMVLLVN